MFAISYLFAYSFNIVMRPRHPIVPVCGPPDPVRVHYSGSDNSIDQVTYIVCPMGGCPKDMSFVVSVLAVLVRFIRSLEFDSLMILGQILSRLPSSILKDAVFLSSVEDR